ncbi:DUF6612 family protein [Alkalihalophilus lindianensis]|uniref:DUF6612 family protein n=1 Tax=Alkalihalophilus lindianensis TaxID=1630542 RepID=A0ABU3X8X4_9BACI|nr:DUF6612 family protein [Alkalihalophilus lindianensis]MDV2684331.1 DUF6612 family protein [Alkalihalophilus lindianensis]
MKRLGLVMALSISFLLVGCDDHPPTSEIYEQAIEVTDQLESVKFQRNQTMRAQQDSFRGQMNGAVVYEPLEFYGSMEMNLLNLNEALQLESYVNDSEWLVRQNQQEAEWEEYDRTEFQDTLLEHPSLMLEWFEPYQDQFLMKETAISPFQEQEDESTEGENGEEVDAETEEVEVEKIDVYEISFRGADEQYKPLVQTHIEQMGLVNRSSVNLDDVMETVEIERIDMTVFVDKETYDVHRLQTRFRYLVYIEGEYRVIDESLLLRFDQHNEPIDFDELKNEE